MDAFPGTWESRFHWPSEAPKWPTEPGQSGGAAFGAWIWPRHGAREGRACQSCHVIALHRSQYPNTPMGLPYLPRKGEGVVDFGLFWGRHLLRSRILQRRGSTAEAEHRLGRFVGLCDGRRWLKAPGLHGVGSRALYEVSVPGHPDQGCLIAPKRGCLRGVQQNHPLICGSWYGFQDNSSFHVGVLGGGALLRGCRSIIQGFHGCNKHPPNL